MEIRRSAPNLHLQTAAGAAPGEAEQRLIASEISFEARARSRGQSPGRHGQGPVEVEPSHAHEPAQTEVHEKEQYHETAAVSDDGNQHWKQQPVAEEIEGEHSAPEVEEFAGSSAQNAHSGPLSPWLPETTIAGGVGGGH